MRTKFIAEICSNHNQDLKRCKRFIDVAKEMGCWGVKFQYFKEDSIYRKSYLDANPKLVEQIKLQVLPDTFISELWEYAKNVDINIGYSVFDVKDVEELNRYTNFYKVASYELLYLDLIKEIVKKDKPIIVSTGMVTIPEMLDVYELLKDHKQDVYFLHCVSSYPAKPEDCNLNSINFLRLNFPFIKIGWSDHTRLSGIIYHVALKYRADIIEFHFDLDGEGREAKMGYNHCWLPNQIEPIIKHISQIRNIEGSYSKLPKKNEAIELRTDPKDGMRPRL